MKNLIKKFFKFIAHAIRAILGKAVSKVDVVLGLQWGDEGKGKVVDVLTPNYGVIARFQGGPNAGHTLVFDGNDIVLHTIPSGIFRPGAINVIGNGVVIDPVILYYEIKAIEARGISVNGKLQISKKAHLILPTHRVLDAANEAAKGKAKIGSTLKGIGPTYTDKTGRNGLRVGDIMRSDFKERYKLLKCQHLKTVHSLEFNLDSFCIDNMTFDEYEELWLTSIDRLKEFELIDSEYAINRYLDNDIHVLAEGAQGSLLDIDFGTYPFVTSSNTMTAGVCTGLGVAPSRIGKVMGIFKAYCTRVGSGPFPTELFDATGERLRSIGHEYGATTGRPRRCGWLDLVALRYAVMMNGVTELILMKADVMNGFDTLKVANYYKIGERVTKEFPSENLESVEPVYTYLPGWKEDISKVRHYRDFPQNFKNYVAFIEKETGCPVKIISVGPDRSEIVIR